MIRINNFFIIIMVVLFCKDMKGEVADKGNNPTEEPVIN